MCVRCPVKKKYLGIKPKRLKLLVLNFYMCLVFYGFDWLINLTDMGICALL